MSHAARIRQARERLGWQPHDLAQAIIALTTTDIEPISLIRMIRRWEAGKQVSAQYRNALADALGLDQRLLFAADHDRSAAIADAEARLLASDIDAPTMETIVHAVDRICTAYSTDSPELVLHDGQAWFLKIEHMLNRRPGIHERTLRQQAAQLALICGCLHNDMGDRDSAEQRRRTAAALAAGVDGSREAAWAHEMSAWFALTDREWGAALTAARSGQQAAPSSDVAIHLAGQEAEALAWLGQADEAQRAMNRGLELAARLAPPVNPRNHLVIDAPKAAKSEARVAMILGNWDTATNQAERVLSEGRRPDGTHRMPMRVADAKATLAVVAARRGDSTEAIHLLHEALDVERISLPSLLMVVSEVLDALPPDASGIDDLTQRVSDLRTEADL